MKNKIKSTFLFINFYISFNIESKSTNIILINILHNNFLHFSNIVIFLKFFFIVVFKKNHNKMWTNRQYFKIIWNWEKLWKNFFPNCTKINYVQYNKNKYYLVKLVYYWTKIWFIFCYILCINDNYVFRDIYFHHICKVSYTNIKMLINQI